VPLPRFQRLAAEKQSQLLEVAAKEFAERGFEAASLNEILARAGFGKSSYYYYFEDKEDLYTTCVLDSFKRMVPDWASFSSEALDADNFWSVAEGWVDSLVSRSASHPVYMALVRDAPAMRKMLGPKTRALADQLSTPIVGAIRRGQQLGCVRTDLDPEQLWLVGMAADAALDEELLAGADPITEADLRRHARLVLDTWRRLLAPQAPPLTGKAAG
jgi:AcrR family transcriptional regulator